MSFNCNIHSVMLNCCIVLAQFFIKLQEHKSIVLIWTFEPLLILLWWYFKTLQTEMPKFSLKPKLQEFEGKSFLKFLWSFFLILFILKHFNVVFERFIIITSIFRIRSGNLCRDAKGIIKITEDKTLCRRRDGLSL